MIDVAARPGFLTNFEEMFRIDISNNVILNTVVFPHLPEASLIDHPQRGPHHSCVRFAKSPDFMEVAHEGVLR